MALEFSLEAAMDVEPNHALHLIADTIGVSWADQDHLSGLGVRISAINGTDLRKLVIADAFQFVPSLSVGFRVQPKENYQEGKHTVLRAVMVLLDHFSGDAVLLFNGEDVVLQRLNSSLVINNYWSQWSTAQLAEIDQPYELRTLISPLL